MTHPRKVDPLAFSVTDALFSVADEAGLHIIACINDSILDLMTPVVRSGVMRLDAFIEALRREHEIIVKDGWLIVRPTNPAKSERTRVSRDALEVLVQSCVQGLSIRDFAKYCHASGFSAFTSPVTDFYVEYIRIASRRQYPHLGRLEPHYYATPIMLFLGSLSDQQWTMAIERGAEIRLAGLSPTQRGFFRPWQVTVLQFVTVLMIYLKFRICC